MSNNQDVQFEWQIQAFEGLSDIYQFITLWCRILHIWKGITAATIVSLYVTIIRQTIKIKHSQYTVYCDWMNTTDPEFHDIDKEAILMDFPVIEDTLNKVSIGGDTNPVYL